MLSDSTLKQLITYGVSNTCTLPFIILVVPNLYFNHRKCINLCPEHIFILKKITALPPWVYFTSLPKLKRDKSSNNCLISVLVLTSNINSHFRKLLKWGPVWNFRWKNRGATSNTNCHRKQTDNHTNILCTCTLYSELWTCSNHLRQKKIFFPFANKKNYFYHFVKI